MRLSDYFAELIAYVLYFLRYMDRKSVPFEQLRNDIQRLLSESERCLQENRFPTEDYQLGRFAVCAWIDEAILSSSWDYRGQWQKEQLQRLYYNTTEAGEEFFDKLNKLGPQQREVREIFYLCLAMGFKGRYCNKGDEMLLEQLETSNLKMLMGSSMGLPSLQRTELFPEAYPSEQETRSEQQKSGLSPYAVILLTAPVVLLGILFVVYHFLLSNIGENLLTKIS